MSFKMKPLKLTPMEKLIFDALMSSPNELVEHAKLNKLRVPEPKRESNIVSTNIKNIRAKLKKAGAEFEIEPIRGKGYIILTKK